MMINHLSNPYVIMYIALEDFIDENSVQVQRNALIGIIKDAFELIPKHEKVSVIYENYIENNEYSYMYNNVSRNLDIHIKAELANIEKALSGNETEYYKIVNCKIENLRKILDYIIAENTKRIEAFKNIINID